MYYGNGPIADDAVDHRTGGAFDAQAHPHHIHDSENVLTLDQLHQTVHGKGNRAPGAGRNHTTRLVFGNIGNTSRLVNEAQARRRGGGSADGKLRPSSRGGSAEKQRETPTPPVHLMSGDSTRSGATARTVGAASMDWDSTGDEAAAIQAAATRRRAGFEHSAHDTSPRTPVVESPEESVARTDDDEATPLPQPGALTIQRLNLNRRSRMMGMDEDDLDREMQEQHRRQHALMHEGPFERLLLWRDATRTGLVFGLGIGLLGAARAPGLVANHVPVNPVVVAAYASMAFLCRAYFLAMAFPRRHHGLSVDVEGAADFARWCAECANAVTMAHDDLLSGRGNKAVLRAFICLYAVASLGGLLNSTWGVACVLWAAAFTVPPAIEAQRHSIMAVTQWVSVEVGGRWNALSSNQRWSASAAVVTAVFLASSVYTRLILLFVILVAVRLFRETHRKQLESFERAVKNAGRRLSLAGSEFHAMMGSPGAVFYRRCVSNNNSSVSWN